MQFTEKIRLTSSAVTLSRVYGFWRSLILALVLAILSVSGAFEPLDGRLYDFFVRHSLDLNPVTRKVVLVESPASTFSDSTIPWGVLADDLISLGAAQVIFTVVPTGHNAAIETLLKNPKVILGADLTSDLDRSSTLISSLPDESGDRPPHAASVISDPLLGVQRYQRYAYRVGDKDVPSLEALAAHRLGIEVPKEGRYLVDFSGDLSGFPRIKLNQVINGELIDDVVRDRVILIGPASERFHRTVVTPITEGGREVTELEYHGYALDSLLRGTPIASFHPIARGLIVIGIWLVCLLILQPMPFRKAVLTAFFMALGLVLFAWLLLSQHFHFPVLGSILVIGSSLVSIFHSKTEYQNQALARLVTETNLAASGRLTGQSVPFDAAFWSHVLAMIDQILPLARVVLLERVDGGRHVQEVRSLRCSVDAIEERRRDFGRAPYSTAIERGEAIEVRKYLMDAEIGEHQFLAPLVWSGQVQGFWVFGIDRSQMANRPTLMRAVDVLSKRLSELMFERRQNMMQGAMATSWREHLIDQRDLAIQKLTQHLNMNDRHINVLEDMFNGLEAPTMVYDLFGRPLISNARMKSLLQTAEVQAEAQSAADLLETVCSLSSEESRAALVSVVFNGDSFERAAHVGNTRYLLHVSRLRNSAARVMTGQDVLQHIHGLMIQFFPVTNLEMRERSRSERLLQDAELPLDGRAGFGAHEEDEEEVDVLHAVEAAIASTASFPEHETLCFAVNGPQGDTKALANPRKFKDILTVLIRFLAEDSKQQGKITVTLDTDEDGLIIDLQNNGFGMPNEKLQAMLDGPALPRSDYLRRIRQLRNSAFGNHGRLALRSTVGGGYVAKATMRLAG